MVNPNTLKPKSPAQALRRRIGAATLAALAVVGGGKVVSGVFANEAHRPTAPVTVQPGDTVDKYAHQTARQMGDNVDYRDIRNQIIEQSPDAQDGVIHPGDTLNVPMTDEQITQAEERTEENRG